MTLTARTRSRVAASISATLVKRPVIPAFIDQRVEPAERVVDRLERGDDVRFARRRRFGSARRARPVAVDLRGDELGGGAVLGVRERDVVARGGGAAHDRCADPAAAAGDQTHRTARVRNVHYFATASRYAILRPIDSSTVPQV